MPQELFENRKKEFIEYINKNHRLPKLWEYKFKDGEDLRLWFNKISKVKDFNYFIEEVKESLNKYGMVLLTDIDKENEFLLKIAQLDRLPYKDEEYFIDNDEMINWYNTYKKHNKSYETKVENNLKEYQELDMAVYWPRIKKEFISIIKQIGKIPDYGIYYIQDGIDVRVIYDKLYTYDQEFIEQLLLHLQTEKYTKKGLTTEERVKQFLECVLNIGYIPYFRECRFTDNTGMFTWYNRYKDIISDLKKQINNNIDKYNGIQKVNIYLIPNFKNKGGKFYTICTNTGEVLDLSNVTSYEEARKLDSTLVKRGGVILKKDEEINSVHFTKGKSKK